MFVSEEEHSIDALERTLCELGADINAATCRWLSLLAEFERRSGHERAGFHSCTGWLAWNCGLTPRAAREHVRVARRLVELPRIAAAFGAGELSYSKVRALSRVASPELEAELLEVARHATAAQLETVVRELRRATEDPDELARERRHLAVHWEPEGMMRVSGRLPAEEGELLLKAIEAARDVLRGPLEDGIRPDRADGLAAIAESFLARGPAALAGGERNQVVVHIDVGELADGGGRGAAGEAGRGGVASVGGGAISPEAGRRLACDAAVVTLLEQGGEPLSVGRKTRAIPAGVRRALEARDVGCRFPGCTHERFVDAHHIHHWAAGGETSLDNLVLLCRTHHRLLHEGGFTIEGFAEGGDLIVRRPDGRQAGSRPRMRPPRRLPSVGRRLPLASGDALDADHAVMVLAARAPWRPPGPQRPRPPMRH